MRHIVPKIVLLSQSLSLLFLGNVHAQQLPPQLHWSSDDAKFLEVSGNQLHLIQREQSGGPRIVTATASLNLPYTTEWSMTFQVRFGQIQDAADSVRLMRGDNTIGWVGADGFYKGMGVFIGKDNEVTAPTADTEWHEIKYTSHDDKTTVLLDGKQIGEGATQALPDMLVVTNTQDMNVACHQTGVWLRGITLQPQDKARSAALSVTSGGRPALITVKDDEQTICCLPGDTLRLTGHFNSSGKLQTAFLDNGSDWMFKREAKGASDDYSYDWQAPKAGVYTLEAAYLNDANIRVNARHLQVNVLPSEPFSADLPKSAVSDVVVPATPSPQVPFHTDNITFYLDGKKMDTVEGKRLTAKLPLGDMPAGQYPFFYDAVDQQRGRFIGSTSTITIPERVQVTLAPAVQIASPNDKVPLSISLAPGVTPAKVVYSFGGQQVGVSDHAPFTTSVSLAAFKSGNYDVQAVATDTNGRTIASPAASVSFTNQPDDIARALAAKIAAEQKAKEDQSQAQIAQQEAERQVRLAKEEAERPAREAAAKRAELQRILNVPPKVPPGEGPRKCALAIRDYLATDERNKAAEDRSKLDEISDIKSSDSKIYPYDVYAIVKFPDYDAMTILTLKVIFAVNPETNQVSDYTRKWGD